MNRPTVAIMMSNFNHARYLPESLAGIEAQTRPADEVILIDDASTDNSAEILERFARKHPSVRFIRNEQRLGVQRAISSALSVVTADYLVWTAADDCLLPQFLDKSMAVLERYPQAALCFSETTQLLGNTGQTLRFATDPRVKHLFDLSALPDYLAPDDLIRRMKQNYLAIASNTVVVRRDALVGLKGYPQQLEWYADSFAYTALALRRGACVVAETLALIRTTPGSYSQAMYDPARQSVVLQRMLDLLASEDYRDIRRIFRACPSNFSPGFSLMLRLQLRKVRDWDLFVPYFIWKVKEYKRGHALTWGGMLRHLFWRLAGGPRISQLEAQLNGMKRELESVRTESAAMVNTLRAERHGLANALTSLRNDYEAAKACSEQYERMLQAVGVATQLAPTSEHTAAGSSSTEEIALGPMIAEMQRCNPIFAPSRFWQHFNELNLQQLQEKGFGNFKLTANQNYHNFVPRTLFDPKIRRLIKLWKQSPTLKPVLFSIEPGYVRTGSDDVLQTQQAALGFSNRRMFAYRTFVTLVWLYSRSKDTFKVLDRLQEPALGNPIRVVYGEKLISQDLATSAREFNAMMREISRCRGQEKPLVVAELGAGYGRLAHVFLEMTPCRYVVFDIPPALAIGQWYLRNLFPRKKLFPFRSFGSFSEIQTELESSDIAFFTANQLAYFPDRYFDLSISISSLHEMRFEQIDHYLAELSRLTKEFIYLKQYYRYPNTFDNVVVGRKAYEVPGPWETLFDKTEDIYTDFFELMQKRTASA